MRKTMLISKQVRYFGAGFGDIALISAEGLVELESGKFTLKITSESGKLFTIGCHLPPKSAHFGTLAVTPELLNSFSSPKRLNAVRRWSPDVLRRF